MEVEKKRLYNYEYMKIALVVTGLPNDLAPARSAFNVAYAKALVNKNHDVTFIYVRSIHPKRKIVYNTTNDLIKTLELSVYLPKTFFNQSKLVKGLFKFLLKNHKNILKSFDVYHAIGGNALESAYTIAQYFKKPLIVQFIGSDLNLHFAKLLKNKSFLKGISYSSYRCFNSKALQNIFVNEYEFNESCKVLYRGIDLSKYQFNFQLDDSLNIIFLGGFPSNEPNIKGGETLLDAINILKKEEYANPIKIKIGGPNSIQIQDKAHSISNFDIEFIGAISRMQVLEELKKSHIVIIPSVNEGLPNVLYESMATGNVIIATNVGGIPEVLDSTGLLEPNNSILLADKILQVINKDTPESMFQIAKINRRIIENFDSSNFINSYIQLYTSCTIKID